jgi:curved DNA-binding protein CbpA
VTPFHKTSQPKNNRRGMSDSSHPILENGPATTSHLQALLMYGATSPDHLLSGLGSGLHTLGLCVVGGVLVLVALPTKLATDAHRNAGLPAAIAAGTAGTIVGALAGAVTVAAGGLQLAWQLVVGLVRTPAALIEWLRGSGRHWDGLAREWAHYDMHRERDMVLNVTEDEFLRRSQHRRRQQQKDSSSGALLKSLFASPIPSPFSLNTEGESASERERRESRASRRRRPTQRAVQDRVLYDVLQVDPHASSAEIKRAYHRQARAHHPDRHTPPQQSTGAAAEAAAATRRFQRVAQAYQILGDESLRRAYDQRGQALLLEEEQGVLQAGLLYRLVFGAESFEGLVGELQIAHWLRLVAETSTAATASASTAASRDKNKPSSDVSDSEVDEEEDDEEEDPALRLQFRQRARELALAEQLASRLDVFVRGDLEAFRRAVDQDCLQALSGDSSASAAEDSAPETDSGTGMGSLLLSLVGAQYVQWARRQLQRRERERRPWYASLPTLSLSPAGSKATETGGWLAAPWRALSRDWSLATAGLSMLSGALRLASLKHEADELLQADRNASNNDNKNAGLSLEVFYGPRPNAQRKELVNRAMRDVLAHS